MGHVDLDSIEAEAADMAERDLPQAHRFFGNGLVTGAGKAFDLDRWAGLAVKSKVVPDGALITIGFDGSRRWDHTALIATEVASGYQWPLGIWRADDYHGEIPSDLVNAAVETAFETWDVWRMYADPPYWEDTVASWAGTYGDKRVIPWWTNRPKSMAYALRAWSEAQLSSDVSHCPVSEPLCKLFAEHVGNAYKQRDRLPRRQRQPVDRREGPAELAQQDRLRRGRRVVVGGAQGCHHGRRAQRRRWRIGLQRGLRQPVCGSGRD